MRCLLFCLLLTRLLTAEPVAVRYVEGSLHGFLSLRSMEGKLLASGDLTQEVHGSRVISHLVYRFKDGSLDDETAVFTQRGTFRLVSDRHIQKGPAFPTPTDTLINVATGMVTVHYQEKGKPKIASEHMDLPPDLANGVILDILKNIPPKSIQTKLSWIAATPKPRLVKLSVTAPATETFSIAGISHNSTRLDLKIEIGGLAGLIAPVIGKQPPDIHIWISDGAVPAFVKSEGPQALGGPAWRIELMTPAWASASKE